MSDTPASFQAQESGFAGSLLKLGRVLMFRATREELLSLNRTDLLLGLLFTWVVGMGRYWDNPKVPLLQNLGVGSVIYVFILGALLWCVIGLLRPRDWSYLKLVTFLTFTSPPALIYAVPVQFWMGITEANLFNAGFLVVVAVWRIALLNMYLKGLAELSGIRRFLGISLPIMGIIFVLFTLNLERVAYDFMSGAMNADPNGDAYLILVWAVMITLVAIVPVAIAYIFTVVAIWRPAARIGGTNRAPGEATAHQESQE